MWIIDIHLAGLTFLKYRTLQTYDNLIMNFDSIPPPPTLIIIVNLKFLF